MLDKNLKNKTLNNKLNYKYNEEEKLPKNQEKNKKT